MLCSELAFVKKYIHRDNPEKRVLSKNIILIIIIITSFILVKDRLVNQQRMIDWY